MDTARRITRGSLQATLRAHNVRPSKSLGQNFLLDHDVVEASLAAAQIGPNDTILEVGPGAGVLTLALLRAARRVVAVELDHDMLRILAAVRRDHPHLELVEANVIRFPPSDFVGADAYKVVANLPYYLTSVAIRHFLEALHRPELLVLLLQREVAERICAKPNDMSLLALSVQLYAAPEILRLVPAASFYPEPKVESALVRLTVRAEPLLPRPRIPMLFLLAQAGFGDRRKQLHNSLRINLRLLSEEVTGLLDAAGIDGRRRAETLALEEWGRLAELAEGMPRVVQALART
ncbi:MAG TPA: 16S rRNA (adenine(1518)-N(6)/adenine(1519)-N(6))-dimethyltransferase RsmA [Chloroflexota bacterium]|nr:16S rRNA (adenine(1518)-N(6)/adenine(1519)-N(6))-dimethyltransferase RsmA [Chloroflexota bacterium]